MSHPSPYSWQVGECMYTKRTVQAWMLDPYRDRIRWLCNAVVGILLAWFGSTCPLRVNSHCKSIQDCSEWSPFILWWNYPDSSGPFQDDNAPIHSARGVTDGYEYKDDVNHMLWNGISGRFWTEVLDSALHHHCQNTDEGISFGKIISIHPRRVLETSRELLPRCIEAVLAALVGPTPF